MGLHDIAVRECDHTAARHGSMGDQWPRACNGEAPEATLADHRALSTCCLALTISIPAMTCWQDFLHPLQVIPSGQSLIADYYIDSNRGKAFGGLFLTGAVGGMLGSLYATNLGKSATSLAEYVHVRAAQCNPASARRLGQTAPVMLQGVCSFGALRAGGSCSSRLPVSARSSALRRWHLGGIPTSGVANGCRACLSARSAHCGRRLKTCCAAPPSW